jgi:glycosyltransferase involved in cell wall biosynthesis
MFNPTALFNSQFSALGDSGIPESLIVFVVYAVLVVFLFARGRRNYLALPELPRSAASDSLREEMKSLSVVIPARNEERNIERAVASFPGLDVIVANDGSTDRTAGVAATAGARVVNAAPLPSGYSGKPWALMAGAKETGSKWILFADADTSFDPALVPSLLHYARTENAEFVTPFLRLNLSGWLEKAVVPASLAFFFCGVNPRRVNDKKDRWGLINGQCLLAAREPYDFVGGHKSVVRSAVEDVELASRLKLHRMAVRVVRAEHLGSVRMYPRFRQVWRGIQKDSFRFLAARKGVSVLVVLSAALLWSWLPILGWLLSDQQWIAAAACFLLPSFALRKWYAGIGKLFWAPLGTVLFPPIAIAGILRATYGLPTESKRGKA